MNMKNINFDDVSILVVGFDGYIDVWNHFFKLMNKNWPDRPKTYLASSELTPHFDNVEVIPAGPNSEWSLRAQTALNQIKTPYVILMLEDFFVSKPVDNNRVREALDLIKRDNIKFYQILVQLIKQTWEKGKSYKGHNNIRIIPQEKKYPLNLQAAIWNTSYLREVIGSGNYNAWQFEINQIDVHCNVERIDSLIDVTNILNITHTVVQSKYLRGAVKDLEKMGYSIDLSERPLLSKSEDFKYMLKLFMYSATPKCLVKPFKKVGKLFNVDFVTDRIGAK